MNAAEMDRTGGDSPEGVIDPPLDVELIRAYVQRAHRLTPTLTADAAELVKEDYVDIRSDDRFADMLGEVSSRSVGTIHALAEASARIRLSETTEPEDVERATEIHRAMKSNLSDTDLSGVPEGVGPDTFEAGTDGSLSKTGASRSDVDIDSLDQKARLDHVFQTMGELANETESNDDPNHVAAYEADIRDELLDHGFSGSQIDHDIDKLAKQDRVYQPKIGQYDTL
jgi:replicative DNA helicase Mcm